MGATIPLRRSPPPSDEDRNDQKELRAILGGGLRSVYQPIVDLEAGSVVGYEALARGPAGSPLESPAALFPAAARLGLAAELDTRCFEQALTGAAGTDSSHGALFVNVEPLELGNRAERLAAAAAAMAGRRQIVVELTERALASRPAELLAAVGMLRAAGCAIALDDVGADVRSLALLPLVRPDVIKLDLALVQNRPSAHIASVVNAVAAESERSGATVLAEGIETERHARIALGLGARLGQGYLYGRPGPVMLDPIASSMPGGLRAHRSELEGETPYTVVAAHRRIRCADKALLIEMSLQLEAQALLLGAPGVILSAFQSADRFTSNTRTRYGGLARSSALVVAFGVGMQREPVRGVRGAQLSDDDSLAGEWSVVVLGPHFSGALVARDLGDSGHEGDRRFDYACTYDRELVVAAASSLLTRVVPVAEPVLLPSERS